MTTPTVPAAAPTRSRLSLGASLAWLGAAALLLYVGIGSFASAEHGANGWLSAAIAVTVCSFSGVLALLVGSRAEGSSAVTAMLVSMLLRMAIPSVVALAMLSRGGPLVEAGLVGQIAVAYLGLLLIETMLMVRMSPTGLSVSGKAKVAGPPVV